MRDAVKRWKDGGLDVKDWIVTDLARGKAGIQCPDRECGGKAVVNKRVWLKSRPDFIGRSCTYCFKTFRIPERLMKGVTR